MTKEERRIIAEKHFRKMQSPDIQELTNESINYSIVYSDAIWFKNGIEVIDFTTERAIFEYNNMGMPCVLNFASFTRPGGGFIKGAIAQEEALCHVSNLYNILVSFKEYYDKNFNKPSFKTGLYENWAIYSPSVYFEINNEEKFANVITCPAPNYNKYIEYCDNKGEDINNTLYDEILRSRIKYVLDIANYNDQKILILGAFGCGVFGNDPTKVAIMFKSLLKKYNFRKVIFAIPNNGNGNYEAFKKIFDE